MSSLSVNLKHFEDYRQRKGHSEDLLTELKTNETGDEVVETGVMIYMSRVGPDYYNLIFF